MKYLMELVCAVRTAAATIVVCCILYTAVVWGVAQFMVPERANGHLLRNVSGKIIGSRQVAQKFTGHVYFHPRPSAADYNGAGACGSNLASTSPKLRERAEKIIKENGASVDNRIPADMVSASGSGLDPHITFASAEFQIPRVARARDVSAEEVRAVLKKHVEYPGGIITSEPIVNVLELNLALDKKL